MFTFPGQLFGGKEFGVTVKSELESSWSARAEAVRPIHNQLKQLVELLENIADQNETTETRSDATQILQRILTFEFLVLLHFWNVVLAKIDQVEKRLQDHTMNFHDAAIDIQQKFIRRSKGTVP